MASYDLATLQAELMRDEGERLKPYRDTVGKLTIGIGRNLDDVGISHDEALMLLANDIVRAERWLDRNLPWWGSLDGVRQRVMVNMAFNLGGRLLTFKNTLAAVQRRDWKAAHDGMLDSLWARQVGQRANRLAHMMLTGETA
ncbi:lysozyme [Bordetella genomosp. 9]|uniref:glycoside hydrolase family protein n=1 Tax=Bordetella genomosp. 9 TaxID=1416803 RepID=UPI000A2902CA|nr:glycoside hydrolase family protein [Bordetella genomosp. 9]ARP89835.1 lysozyme [Bordetella genomosp. 9]